MGLRICVDGVNGSGKSTLTGYLSRIYGLDIWHPGPKPLTNAIAVSQCVEQMTMDNIIYDRLTCVTRQIYGDTQENVLGLGRRHINIMNIFIACMIKRNTIFIHTIGRGPHTMKDYYTQFHIDKITANKEILRDRYLGIFKGIPHFEYDFEVQSIKEVLDYVKLRQEKQGRFFKAV